MKSQILDAASYCSPTSESKVHDVKGFCAERRSMDSDDNDSSDAAYDDLLDEIHDINYDYLQEKNRTLARKNGSKRCDLWNYEELNKNKKSSG